MLAARLFAGLAVCALGGCASTTGRQPDTARAVEGSATRLGNFSVSLAVKDLGASRAFYEKLGFRAIGGDPAKNWLILQNETATIGLFQGMFPRNTLTFNPGWDRAAKALPDFEDVRDIQKTLKGRGLTPVMAADESSSGPASFMLVDPDGNPVLVDQHVPRPTKK
jgi:catechol 2,3-dioxygenase-like lactoylglutathione lyase family enzyme